jgi:hypothetical protein
MSLLYVGILILLVVKPELAAGAILIFAITVIPFLIGLCLFIAGRRGAVKWTCPTCSNPIVKDSKLCPTCEAELD